MAKKYVVQLAAGERERLERITRTGKGAAWRIQRVHALLKCDQGPHGPGQRTPQPTAPVPPARIDFIYVRKGVCSVWMFVEPLAGWRAVEVTDRRTAVY